MAAIAREARLLLALNLMFTASLLVPAGAGAAPDPSSSARQQVAAVAEALSSGDVSEAMTHFSKSMPDYVKIRRCFEGLSSFQVENQLDYTDEDDSDSSVTLTITWDITLTDLASDRTRRRSGAIHVKVALVDAKWRIVEFSPLDIFNPQID